MHKRRCRRQINTLGSKMPKVIRSPHGYWVENRCTVVTVETVVLCFDFVGAKRLSSWDLRNLMKALKSEVLPYHFLSGSCSQRCCLGSQTESTDTTWHNPNVSTTRFTNVSDFLGSFLGSFLVWFMTCLGGNFWLLVDWLFILAKHSAKRTASRQCLCGTGLKLDIFIVPTQQLGRFDAHWLLLCKLLKLQRPLQATQCRNLLVQKVMQWIQVELNLLKNKPGWFNYENI